MADFETQRRLADVLRQQAAQPIQAGNGPVSWTQGLEKLAQGLYGGRLANLANQGEQKQQRLQSMELEQFMRALKGERAAGPLQPGVMPSFQTPQVQGMAAQWAMEQAKPPEAYTLSPGQVRFVGERPVATAPEKTDYNKPFLPDGSPNLLYQDYQRAVSEAGAPSTRIENNMAPQANSAYLNQRAGAQAETMGELERSAASAHQANIALDQFMEASVRGDDGAAQPFITGAKNLIASFGFAPDSLSDTAKMEQAVGQILGAKMSELGARGLTDQDMKVLREALPRVNTSHEARMQIADIIKKANARTITEYVTQANTEQERYPEYQFMRPSWFQQYANPEAQGGTPQGVRTYNPITDEFE